MGGADSVTIDAQNIQWPQAYSFTTGHRGTMALGVKDVQAAIPDVLTGTEDFETDPISGSGTWTLTASSPHSGLRCLRSAVIGNNGVTDYTFNVPPGTNFIRFWHRVSSETNFDFFRVYKDAIIPANLLFQLSGTANVWAQSQFNIAGSATITFRYIKDSSALAGLDASFIDDIEWIATLGQAAIELYEPFHLNTENCVKVVLCNNEIVIDGEVNIRPLTCETDSITVCPPVSGVFEVEVINDLNTRPLECETDSVTICPGELPIMVVPGTCFPVNVRLTCEDDSITVCPPLSGGFLDSSVDSVLVVNQGGTLNNGAETAVGAAAVQVAAANSSRKKLIIQNVGLANIRFGASGVTATTGTRLVPGGHAVFDMPDCPTNAIFAIREGAISSTVLVQQVV